MSGIFNGAGTRPWQAKPRLVIYHLVTRTAWEQALRDGSYAPDSLREQGFIHFSLDHQWRGVRQRFYAQTDDLLLLEVDEGRLSATLVFEPGEPGEDFPHLYGPLNLDAVIQSRQV